MQHYTSCHWIQHGLSFENDHIEMCCLCCHKGGGRLYIKDEYKGKGLKWDDIFKLKEKFIEENKNGIIDPRCEGCFNLVHKEWDDNKKYINYIHFNHWTHCNSDCIYCYTSWDKKNYQKKPHYKVMPMLKELFKKKLFHPDGEVTFAGGEPTILNEFDDIINILLKNGVNRITVHSSGIKLSKAIEKGIKEGKLSVTFNETRNHKLEVLGIDASYNALGLKSTDWKTLADVEQALGELVDAISMLRDYSASFANQYQMIQTRQNFTEALIDVLEVGADELLLADMNEASAEYLMLQTRQQLAINSLSLASQSAKSILSLF